MPQVQLAPRRRAVRRKFEVGRRKAGRRETAELPWIGKRLRCVVLGSERVCRAAWIKWMTENVDLQSVHRMEATRGLHHRQALLLVCVRTFRGQPHHWPNMPSSSRDEIARNSAAAAIAGGVQIAIFNPLDCLRIRWQVATTPPHAIGAFASSIVAREGFARGLLLPGQPAASVQPPTTYHLVGTRYLHVGTMVQL